MANAGDMARMVPGFDFFQGLLKNAGAGLPAMGQWVAPTLDPDELEKRIRDLKTVQFWLEQNARLLGTTVQALEVQRMTLSTLKTMNLPLADLGQSLKIKMPEPEVEAVEEEAEAVPEPRSAAPKAAPPPAAVDPMQWWGALTQQFTELATQAVKDTSAEAGKHLAGALVKQSMDTAGGVFKKAADVSAKAMGVGMAAPLQAMARQMSSVAAPADKPKAAAKKPAAKKRSAKKGVAAKSGGGGTRSRG